jgi:Ion channel
VQVVGVLVGLIMIVAVLVDAFEATVFPRRVTHAYRFSRLYFRNTWKWWSGVSCRLAAGRRRESFLSTFGPLSMLGLFGCWVAGLIVGYATLHWSLATPLHLPANEEASFSTYLYLSGTTLFTLGYGDVTPAPGIGRFLAVIESGMGFGFLAVIISYLPVLYQAFSRREATISLLDARAGSPPSAAEFLRRHALAHDIDRIGPLLAEWERWAAEVLESQLSFPVLSFYRSQHDNQSWLSALTMILDSSALLIATVKHGAGFQAQATFAMARHVAVDMALVFNTPPQAPDPDRLPPERFDELRTALQAAGLKVAEGGAVIERLAELRGMYEPFVAAMARFLLFNLPPIVAEKPAVDNWQTSAWMRRVPGIAGLRAARDLKDDHFV